VSWCMQTSPSTGFGFPLSPSWRRPLPDKADGDMAFKEFYKVGSSPGADRRVEYTWAL
jgi:hypothetical protein